MTARGTIWLPSASTPSFVNTGTSLSLSSWHHHATDTAHVVVLSYVFGDLTLDQSCRLKPSVKQQIIPPSVAHAVSAPHTEVVVETDEMVAVVDQQRVVEVERTAHEGTVRDGGKVLHM